jgi:DHA1 family multidrug resistance protein-like MFS transporter
MSDFYWVKDPVSRLFSRIVNNGKEIIPTDQKQIFLTLFFAIFSTVTGVGIVVPLLPVYANDMGASGLYVGLIFAAFSISRSFLLPVFGRLSDFKGRKPFIVAGLFSYTLISIAFIFFDSVESLIVLRFIQGAGSAMVMPVVQAYVGEITPEGSEGYSMGLFNLSMFLSLSLGPLMGGGIKDLWSLDAAFICMGIFSGIGLLLCLIFLPPVHQEKNQKDFESPRPWAVVLKDPAIVVLFLFRYAHTFCIGVIWCFMPVFADTRFGLSAALIGVLVMLGIFISGLLHLPMGYLADRLERKWMIIAGGVLSSLAMLLPFYASGFWDLILAVTIFGIGGGVSMPAVMACAVMKGEEKKAMGSVMSVLTVAHSLGMLMGSLAAGLAMDYISLRWAFPCGMAVMGIGTLAVLAAMDRATT